MPSQRQLSTCRFSAPAARLRRCRVRSTHHETAGTTPAYGRPNPNRRTDERTHTFSPAFRVTIPGQQYAEGYENVFAKIDPAHSAVHVFSTDGATHYLTIPINSALIEWHDPAALNPGPRMPPMGAGAFERIDAQLQQMTEGMRNHFGES
ncbi:MAG TPA: hypothetical protein VE913_03460 [Longimicrobium sp.]|nr:hypothetical protein [Longimicrobium sp.]